MHRFVNFVFVFILLSNIHLGFSSDTTVEIPALEEDNVDDHINTPFLLPTTTIIIDSLAEDTDHNVTESIITTTTTTDSITTIVNDEQVKQFLTEYLLNVNLSSPLLSDVTFKTYLNDSILLHLEDHQIVLINKNDGTIKNYYKSASIIPTNQPNFLVIFDDHTQELVILHSTQQQNSMISFKPKHIHIFSSTNTLWIAETSDEVALYISQNSGLNWEKIDNSSSSIVLGWSSKVNSIVIVQHARYVKLLDVTTHKISSILTDVSATKLFSRYLLAKRSNPNDSVAVSDINQLADGSFRPLPRRLQSQGNFYCAIEDQYTQDLLLVFIVDNKLEENNETMPATCNLISYSKQYQFNLTNIDCRSIHNDTSLNTIECSTAHLPFYQVRGLSKNVFLANVASGATTMISFDGGIHWNKTHYECDKMINCPKDVSIVIGSLISSNDAPGIVVGKASDGVDEYVAISIDGGRLWRLSVKGNDYLTATSYPNAVVVTIPNHHQQSTDHSFRYSTDYGRSWHEKTFSNETSFRILSLLADQKNIFYVLTSNDENRLNLIELNLTHLIVDQCARHQLKEWSLHGACINGSKLYYKRRVFGSHCLDNTSEIRSEPCTCSLSDFQCLPGYRRSIDGLCLPKSNYIVSQDCSCHANNTLMTKSRGYVKSVDSQCRNGIENYLSDTYIARRDLNQPNFLLYGLHSQTKRATIEMHTNDFNEDDDDEEEEDSTRNTAWSVDSTYDITALVADENGKQVYMAVEHDQVAIIYRIEENLRQQDRSKKQINFDSNNELYKGTNERIEYLTMDWSTQNLYVLVRNKNTLQQTIFILNTRTHKRRTIVKNQHIQPSILLIDPIKTDLYWITHNSPSVFNIGNLQGQIKKQMQLFSTDTNVSYMSYDPITHEIIFIVNSIIYGLNTLDHRRLSPRMIYEHSSTIHNALLVHPIVYFTNENNSLESTTIYLHAIDILAKSYAKNIAKLKEFDSLKLFFDMTPMTPKSATTTLNGCTNNPCSDFCIPLEQGRFRCLCNDGARYQSCSCPTDERFVTGSCQPKNGQCALGRVLCQNRQNCAESARLCEQDHTKYTESFKSTARCTLEKPDDGFDCYYNEMGITNPNNTCIPFQWLCDGVNDCPLGNDEEHCHKMTTTGTSVTREPNRCLTDKKFTHVMCRHKCLRIRDFCQDVSNEFACSEQFHLHCQKTHEEDQYVCKCRDDQNHCIAMIEQCDDFDRCERVCKTSIEHANSKGKLFSKPSPITWTILLIAILLLLFIVILIMTLRYRRQRKHAKQIPVTTRTPAEAIRATTNSPPSDTRAKLLNKNSNTANETS